MEQQLALPSTSGARSDQFLRNVFLLKNGDFEVINGQIHMPTESEIATIRARTEQYTRDVEFNTNMSSDTVKEKLEETFPYLKDKGFFCAAKRKLDNGTAPFDFDGSPRRWNGKTIKKKIQGNSALYILESDQVNTSSGISASDSDFSQDVTDMLPWLLDNLHFDIECKPTYSPLQGGDPCAFTFTPGLHSEVRSVYATFEGLGIRHLERTSFGWIGVFPASPIPQVVRVSLTSQDGIILGYTQVTYGLGLTKLQQIVSFASPMRECFEDLMGANPSGNSSGKSGGETESFRTLGCKKPAQMLSLLVYVAAEIGAQQFIEIIFTSSAKRVVHNAYKRNLTLPETIARDHGYIETANYLADVTKRFSEETTTDNECSQTIDWSELVKAAEAAENQLDLTNEKQNGQVETNDPKETGYLADADTSSSDASAPQSSDSEDDISNKTETTATATTTTRKGSVSGRECQIGLPKDQNREDHNTDTGDPIADNYRGCKETLHQFDIDLLLKEGKPTVEDIKCLARDISDDPNELRKFYELLGLSNVELEDLHEPCLDTTDKATIRRHLELITQEKCKNITYKGLATVLDHISFHRRDLLQKYCLIQKDLIPTYILARGGKDLAAYRTALKSAKTYDKRFKVFLIGEDHVGNTNLGKALKGESFRSDEASTDGVLMSDISSLVEDTFGEDEVDNCKDNDSHGIGQVIWNFASQAVYRAIHPIFMPQEAVYVLAFDLSKHLFDKAGGNGRDNPSLPNPDSESNLDHIMRWMDIVHSLKYSADSETLPPVILVGTHADSVKDDPDKIMECLVDRFCKNRLLGEHIAGRVAVDNTPAGKTLGQEDPGIVHLRRQILKVANKLPHTKKEVPLQWLYIESKIHHEAQYGVKYTPKLSFKEEFVEKVCKIKVDDVEPILNFLHDRGTIIYHENANNPNGLVVLDPQWLVNVLCKISVVTSREEKINIRSHRQKLREKGILAKKLLDHACREQGLEQVEESLLFLMEKFNLLFRCPSMDNEEIYLVPCMLTARPGKEIIPTADDTSSSPVYVTFKTEYVPIGLFYRLVVLFGVWAATKSSCEQQQIFANAARFVLDGKNFLGLVCFKSVVKLHVWTHDKLDPFCIDSGFYSEVYSCLERSLETMREECHWLRSVSWDLCVQCRLCPGKVDSNTGNCIWHDTKGCLHDDCAHYIPLKSGKFYCPDAKGDESFLHEENFESWVQAVNNKNTPDEIVGQSTLGLSPEPLRRASRPTTYAKQVMLLAREWESEKGGLSTLNRQLAIELAKSPNQEVSFYVTKCSEEEKRIAASNDITLIKAKELPGYEDLDRLSSPPEKLPEIGIVIGHGAGLGKQLIQRLGPKCVWVQVEHTAPEKLAMYKNNSFNISRGEQKHHTEVELADRADMVVAVGPKLTEMYKTYLRHSPNKKVLEIIPDPSIFHEFRECRQGKDDREKFKVLMFGRGDADDFELKGFDIAAKAIAELKDQGYHLFSVGAPNGEEEEVAERLLRQGISRRQLSVLGFIQSRAELAKLLCQVDLAIMPSRTEGFGLTALEALSAGLPILVSGNSGFAKALENMESPLASSCVVDSEDAKDWAKAIQAVKEKSRSERLRDAQRLKKCCVTSFAWSKRCQALETEMLALLRERKGDDKDSGKQGDAAATDAQCVQYMTEENEQKSQSASSSSRRFQAVENRETCNHVPCQTGGPTYYYYYNTCISASGFTAVGPGAQANNFHQPPARGVVHAYGHSPRHDSPRVKEQQEPTYNGTYMYDRAKPGWKSFSSENNSGTYCLPNISEACYQQKFGPKWSPKPSKGILTQQGVTDACSSIESFLKDVEKSMGEFDNADGPLKEEKEQFILLQLLPHLEVSWGKSPTKKMDAYWILAKISSSRSGGEVVKHALLQLQYLLFRDNLESCKENTLLKVEKTIRSTINSPDAVFKEEADSVREIRLSVYQRILCLIIVHRIQAGFFTVDFNNDLKKLREELKVCCNQVNYKRKNYFRYSMEFIEEAISYLLKPKNKVTASNLGGCLDQCQDILEKQDFDVMDLTFLRKLKKSRAFAKKRKPGEWFYMHCIMCYLHGKVHSEYPKRQMCTERRAMILLRRILEAYQEEGGRNDWRFCLLAASILSDVAMNNVTKESRIEAASCLINLLKDKKLRRRPECRVILERMSSEVVFSPDPFTKKLFANHLFENKNLSDTLPEELHIQRLATCYRNQTLEVNKTTISQGQRCFVKRGMFQRKEVVVKVLHVTKQDILEGESQDQSETRDRLVREAYNLSRLRVQKHPHITVLLAYNTESFPYHIITEFERYGNLLEFVRASREGNELLPTPLLLKMLLDVIEALMLLQSQGLVHRAVRAQNVLVGDNFVCKLTGMHSLRQLQTESIHSGVQDQDSLYDYCSADDSCLDVISADDENLPVRWKAPECLLEHRYSTASDVWAFGVLMYEVLTYGSHPYSNIPTDDQVISHVVRKGHVLPCELCFISAEYDIMKRCWEWQRRKRTAFSELKEKLGELHDHAINSEEIPRDDPPPLELHISNTPFSHLDNGADDLPKGYQGQDGRLVKERITGADKQHLKKLLTLNHPNLVKIWQIENLETRCPVVEMLSMDSPLGNLKEYVLDRRCQKEDIAMFLSQVASALHYLHVNHIVHGDLRAEYVNVLAPDKIEVARLARSKSLPKRADDVTSTSCAIPCPMPSDSTRWSSPEVILENNYSHASDVWAFGILAWELYSAFATGQEKGGYSLPYCDLAIDKILPHIRDKGPLTKPEGCPDWVYIIMHQCWTYDPVQRPPVIAIFDCLTSRQPMKSWMMSLWLENHEKIEWPDLSISQPEDASHVSIRDGDHFERTIKEMCSEGFFTVHGYKYVQWDATAERVPDEVYDDVERKDCTQNSSFVKDEELCEKTLTCQPRGGCNLRMPPRLPDSNTFSIDPGYKIVEETYDEIAGQNDGCLYVTKEVVELKDVPTECRYQNVQIDVTKTNLEEEELYDDVRGTTVIEDPKVFSTEPRHQNVRTDVIKTAVDMVTEVPCDFEVYDEISDEEPIEEDEYGLYEEIASQSPALCHSSSTDEHSKNFNSKSEYSYTAEDVGRETANSEDEDLYEEVAGAVISNSVEVCGLKSPGSSDESSEAIGCDEFTKNPEKSSVAVKGEAQNHDDSVYTEIGSLQVEDMRLNHKGGCQSTTGNQDTPGNPDTPGYRELLPREYTSLRKKQTSTLNPKDTSPKKNLTKLNNRRHRCYSEDTTENPFGVKEP